MEAHENERLIPYLRSCRKETTCPVLGTVTGTIPKWLEGNLVRVGCGLLEIGTDQYMHVFDGLALMHQFTIKDGKISYQNRFLRSDTYRKNTKANRIVVPELATRAAAPDPCKTIFQRFASLFTWGEATDNNLVNIVKYTDEFYACSELNYLWKIDPETLETQKKVDLNDYVPVWSGTAHPHEDRDGTMYNIGRSTGRNSAYVIIKFPPKEDNQCGAFDKGCVVARIPVTRSLAPSYYHSFAMTENYFIFVEQPLILSVPKILIIKFTSNSFADCMQWRPKYETRFHVVQRSNGELLRTKYISKAFLVFHHINAYEDDDHLVVDMCCYDDDSILKALYVESLKKAYPESYKHLVCQARRYVLPLTINEGEDKNLVKLSTSEAKAFFRSNGAIFCEPELLCKSGSNPELPRIHYEKYNGKKYRYFYGISNVEILAETHLIKVDTKSRTTVSWHEKEAIPSEPVYIADPSSDEADEDNGILLASLLFTNDVCKVAIIILNAKTMEEIGRAVFQTESSVPGDFHGIFIRKS